MEGCGKLQVSERAHPSVVISLVASMARFARHGHPTYSFSGRVSDLIKLRFYRGFGCRQWRNKGRQKAKSRWNFPCSWRGCNCLESLKSTGMRDNLHPRRGSRLRSDRERIVEENCGLWFRFYGSVTRDSGCWIQIWNSDGIIEMDWESFAKEL